ncbi:MAG: Fic family protein [Bdellovibrionaceae bacterium]|nr:Fic family protein [Pseudobdellovibrionaceae bacterium]NUM60210.1 Fic family protein [Pseudobdellovibrionaceae bacterium]
MLWRVITLIFNQQKIKLISFDWLLKLHQLSLQGLTQFPGKVRALPEFGLVLNSKEALTKKQIQGVNSFSLDSKSKSMISFHPLKCFENQKESITSKYAEVNGASLPFDPNDWESVEKNNFFTDSEGIEKQCGYITYLDPKLVNEELEKWINYVNETISAINEHRLNEDFFLAVSKIQRWFIVIHPFERGNGRASRFVLDYIFKSLGFPTSTLRDMNFDLYTNESEWANEIMEGQVI